MKATKQRIRIRFKRAWRGYKAGAEIAPPAALRVELLKETDLHGEKIAELIEEKIDEKKIEEKKEIEVEEEQPKKGKSKKSEKIIE